VIAAAVSGGGLAIGKWPHLASQLQQNVLVAPLSDAGVARLGRFYLITRSGTSSEPLADFLTWLRNQAEQDLLMRGQPARTDRQTARSSKRAVASRR